MRIQASAGRHDWLTDTFCTKLTLTADHPQRSKTAWAVRAEKGMGTSSGRPMNDTCRWWAEARAAMSTRR